MINNVKLLFLLVILVSIELHSQHSIFMAHRAISQQEARISRIRDCNSLIVLKSKLDNANSVVNKYILNQNYPNPFNPSTKIVYQIPSNGNVTLKIYDILGRAVTTLIDEFKTTGRYEVDFNASALASGTYIFRITAEGYDGSTFSEVKSMVLAK